MPEVKGIFVCQQCGKESPKWLGRCPECQAWNSFAETSVSLRELKRPRGYYSTGNKPQELSQLITDSVHRLPLGFIELDRVLGGGLVLGSLVLIGGEPGIGKSTLLLQVSARVAGNSKGVTYISGEESINQVKLRAERLNIDGKGIYFLSEFNLEAILQLLAYSPPDVVIIDSIQTMYTEDVAGQPGSIAQVRECTLRLEHWAKQNNVPVLITGHVTKEGAIAGPGTLEHIVDVVLYFEGEPFSSYRVLRSAKNRFGSTNEIGIFEMRGNGLVEVDNPSEIFLSAYRESAVGSVVTPTLEGSRPLLVEIQALTTPNNWQSPRRMANGIDFNRLLMIAAVLSKRAGLKLFNQDIIVNVTGGFKLNEPAIDLAIALAVASSFGDRKPIPGLVVLGEIGLSGELRGVTQIERRIAEAIRLGFGCCLMPELPPAGAGEVKQFLNSTDIELIQAGSVAQALHLGLTR
ncbi:MAG: DNA repair protein RadA [Chloroflexota bacterium]|nr:DNA repair protein RadA [Chloroflexota bacterium]